MYSKNMVHNGRREGAGTARPEENKKWGDGGQGKFNDVNTQWGHFFSEVQFGNRICT